MQPPNLLSITEQVAEYLRGELFRGRWSGTIPGLPTLSAELGVNRKTVESALRLLEKDGLLIGQGPGRRRRIELPSGSRPLCQLRVALLRLDKPDSGEDFMIELRHLLEEAGHVPFHPDQTLLDLGLETNRVATLVERTEADAWVVAAGSKEVLQWFCQQPKPAFALFGRREGLPIAAAGLTNPPHSPPPRGNWWSSGTAASRSWYASSTGPDPAPPVRAFLEELDAHGIQVGDFNVPDWVESKDGYHAVLDSLFRLTPPTALLTDESFLFFAAQQFLASRGIRVPEDVSLVSTDSDPNFVWCEPSIAHISWDYRPIVRRIVRWAANVSLGQEDLRQTLTRAEFVPGGTIGPARIRTSPDD